MKKTQMGSAGIAFVLAITSILHAQATTAFVPSTSAANLNSMLQAVETATPQAAESVPSVGTFWSAQNPKWPPLPCNINNLDAWNLGNGVYMLDDFDFDYQAQAQSRAMATGVPSPGDDGYGDGGDYTSSYVSCIIDTNRLYLEITGITNGQVDLNLHNGTNQVYCIFSKSNFLSADWNIEQELWPDTNQTVMPFTVPTLERQNLFLRAEDWTGVDSNGDGIPDWWIWKYFGDLSGNATNLDSQGHTLLHDYTNGFDPNVILFDLSTSNRYVNTLSVPLQITLDAGIPSYLAVLMNDTNLAGANWQPFIGTNLTVNLGPGDGVYSVRVGLRGLPVDAYQTWQQMDLTLDTQPPVIIVTNPVLSVISQPMVQLQGYVQDSLGQMSYDLSNAAGVWTGQPGFVTGLGFDTNLFAFTTNFFQCYDVMLTNGVNTIILHATDLAGNTATTNISVTLDYSGDTTAPALTVIWPQDGTAVSGSSFTFAGQVDDATARVTATIVDANGDTNTVDGLVERDGTVWAANLPLAAGTNWLTVRAKDAAGNLSSTNLAVVQSGVMVTIQPLTSDQLNRSLVMVYGMVSDATVEVYVNDVQAGVDPDTGNWEADYVPVSPSGAALLDVEIYPAPGGGGGPIMMSVNDLLEDPAPIGSQRVSQPQAPMVQVVGYSKKEFSTGYQSINRSRTLYSESLTTINWVDGVGGMYHEHSHNMYYFWDGSIGPPFDEDTWEPLAAENPNCPDYFQINMENGTVSGKTEYMTENETVYAQTALKTGKPTGPGQTNLYLVKVLVLEANGKAVNPARVRVPGWTLTPSADDPDFGNFLAWAPDGAIIGMTPQAGVSYDNFGFLFNNVTLQSLTVVSNSATQIDVTNWATVKSNSTNDYVIVQASLNYTNDWILTNAATRIQWTGGEAVPGNPLQRRVPKTISLETTVTASLGSTSTNLDVWVIWGTVSIKTTGTTPTNAVQFGTLYDGTENLGGQTYFGGTMGVGKVVPVAQLTPTRVNKVVKTDWAFRRERWSHTFHDGNPGGMYDTGWTDDTSDPSFQNLTPDSDDKIYDRDAPNVGPFSTTCTEIYKNFHQWIEWKGTKVSDGTPGTDNFPSAAEWHWKAKWQASANPQVILKDVYGGYISLPNASAGCP
jgi:hypothetical protein